MCLQGHQLIGNYRYYPLDTFAGLTRFDLLCRYGVLIVVIRLQTRAADQAADSSGVIMTRATPFHSVVPESHPDVGLVVESVGDDFRPSKGHCSGSKGP